MEKEHSLLNAPGKLLAGDITYLRLNLSSAAQAPVDLKLFEGRKDLTDLEAYAQSKLALTMWSYHLAQELKNDGRAVIAVNPGSLLGSKMVKEGFGMEGKDIAIGADILTSLSLDEEHKGRSGQYFDNDLGGYASPHADGFNKKKASEVVQAIEKTLNNILS